MKLNIWQPLLLAAFLSACANSGEPSKREREEQVSNIKTQLALEYMRGQDYRQATVSIEEALKANSKNDMAWLVRAQIYQYLKVQDKARESFQKALALKPDSAEINNNYGWFLCSSGNNPAQSLAYFDKALADPTYPSPHIANLNKGICSAKLGQFSLAESYLERSLAAAPGFPPAFKELARTKMMAGNLKDADYYFRQYQSKVDVLQADDLLLGWRLAKAQGNAQAAYEYEAQLRANFPYSEQLKEITGR
ncbi:type IV pilus biogenesis/stability protein PilW [Neisseria chenwenguii]|uniref:Type IV pilus biogenesis/stability protein PilW n=1 Tax=Neisseria chenwenguii TaxID=1853278 RepID=A0A220S4G8_9NEIS|nr:type IV pilus biogenesis/stability protein PilW [Neisseria chenwenguii]ASK28340.1 type IV pilus biogenesis/stability protein PilW [Neisseria chenwenguii]ROV55434.1 type IV pilus biogenesis/stability protein PilW [Neisseria chenwenguii]